jgi:hypothetical protein
MKKLIICAALTILCLASHSQTIRLWRTPGSQEWRDSWEAWGNERWAPVSGGGIAWGGITGTISLQSDLMDLLGEKIDTSAIDFHMRAALNAANAPSLANPFATMADLGGSETDPVFTAWLGTNDYLSSSTTSTQDGYFRRIYLKDAINPSHYLAIINEDDLTASRTLNINLGDASRTLTLAGNATISGTNTGDQVEADPVFDAWLTAIPDLSELNNDVGFITNLTGFDTGDLTEGANLYFTDERAQDATGTMATDGSLVYVDATPLLTRGALTGDVTAAQGSNSTAIANDAVTYAKMQDVSAASRLVGRGSAAGSGDPEEITPGTNLTMSTTTLNAQSVSTSGVGASPTSSSTQTITHSLGFIPKIIRIYGIGAFVNNASATPTPFSMGIWNSSGNRCVYMTTAGTSAQASQTSTTFSIFVATSSGNTCSGVIGNVTSTQFDIVWTETGTAAAQSYMWEAE